jgi:hypothetical protein
MIGSKATWLVLLVLLAGCALGPNQSPTSPPTVSGLPAPSGSPTDSASATRAFAEGGLQMDYPAAWREFHYEVISSFSNVIAYLGTVEMQDPCTRTATSITCDNGFHLPPGGIVVVVEDRGFPGYDILTNPMDEGRGVLLRVAGLPARRALTGPNQATGADQVLVWWISKPGSVDNYYSVTAYLRGPDVVVETAQVDAMVTGLRYDQPVGPLPTAGGSAQP